MPYIAGRHTFSKSQRSSILQRDPVCRACGVLPATEADHIVPVAFGGSNTLDNAQGLCAGCHRRKTAQEIWQGVARRTARGRFDGEPHPGSLR